MVAPCGDKENPYESAEKDTLIRGFRPLAGIKKILVKLSWQARLHRFRPLAGIKKIFENAFRDPRNKEFPSPRGDKENLDMNSAEIIRQGFRPLAGIKKIHILDGIWVCEDVSVPSRG